MSQQEPELTDLVRRVEEAAVGRLRQRRHGDLPVAHLPTPTTTHSSSRLVVSLANGFDASPENIRQISEFFASGEAAVELAQAYTSDDLAVLVLVERQHGEVGGLPDQDWSLRVALVFRRVGNEWRLAHRHADPLVHPISLEQLADLTRGDGP